MAPKITGKFRSLSTFKGKTSESTVFLPVENYFLFLARPINKHFKLYV
jgi:hypothetical protein